MFSWECDLADRHDAPTRPCRSDPTAKSWSAQNACGNDPTVMNANPSWDRATQAISDHLDAPDPSIRGHHGIIKVDDHHAIISNTVCKETLDAAVGTNGAMSIKVIDGYVCKDADING
jgi:hypothetical protein